MNIGGGISQDSVAITGVDIESPIPLTFDDKNISLISENDLGWFDPDVVVHWRKWQQWASDSTSFDSLHFMQTCDHSYSEEWKTDVRSALDLKLLSHIICFETWHRREMLVELGQRYADRLLTGVHLGVDTDIYRPAEKDPFKLLWASDPGRGLAGCLDMFIELYKIDRRYTLHVMYPDYVKQHPTFSHPGIKLHRNIANGPKLWDMFNTAAYLPYTSCFKEPSSRAHRQAQAAGCVVMYPENRGSPSELIMDGRTGWVLREHGLPKDWANHIIENRDKRESIASQARMFALTEDWSVQSTRFHKIVTELLSR